MDHMLLQRPLKFPKHLRLIATLCVVPALFADTSKLAPELRGLTGTGNVEVIIQYKNPPTTTTTQQSGGLLGGLVSVVTGVVNTVLNLVGGVLAIVPVDQLGTLSDDP